MHADILQGASDNCAFKPFSPALDLASVLLKIPFCKSTRASSANSVTEAHLLSRMSRELAREIVLTAIALDRIAEEQRAEETSAELRLRTYSDVPVQQYEEYFDIVYDLHKDLKGKVLVALPTAPENVRTEHTSALAAYLARPYRLSRETF